MSGHGYGFGYGISHPSGGGLGPFEPGHVSGLILWLRPEELEAIGDTNPISTWEDQSTSENDGTMTGDNRPVVALNAIDTLAAADYDGVDDRLDLDSAITLTGACEVWALIKPEDGAAAQAILGQHDGTADVFAITATESLTLQEAGASTPITGNSVVTIDSHQLVRFVRDGSDVLTAFVNGRDHSLAGVTNAGDIVVRRVGGVQTAWPFEGHMVELLVYSEILSQTNVNKNLNYFQDRYGTTVTELYVVPEEDSRFASLGTMLYHVSPDYYNLDGASGLVQAANQALSEGILSEFEQDTGSNAGVISTDINSIDSFYFETGDNLHAPSPSIFVSPGPSVMDLTDFTLAMVYRPMAMSGNHELWTEDAATAESAIYVTTAGALYWWDGSTTQLSADGTFSINNNYVIVVTRTSNAIAVYVDGVDVTFGTPSEATDMTVHLINNVAGGAYATLDNLAFSEALSAANINILGQDLTDKAGNSDTWSLS